MTDRLAGMTNRLAPAARAAIRALTRRAQSAPEPGSTSPARERPVVLYDGECGLCKWLLAGLLRWDSGRVLEPVALQSDLAQRLLADLTPEERMASWHLVAPSGERQSAGAALAPMVALLPHGRVLSEGLGRIPWVVNHGYLWVAGHRRALSKLVPAAWKRAGAALVAERAGEQAT
jgi:predicted DCC family thiol-disulfide oxidoreductase YuxK